MVRDIGAVGAYFFIDVINAVKVSFEIIVVLEFDFLVRILLDFGEVFVKLMSVGIMIVNVLDDLLGGFGGVIEL